MKASTLQKKIMRRIYYAYAIAVASHTMFWQGLVLGACIALFGRLTHVASIAHNFLAIPTTNIPSYVSTAFMKALTGGEMLTAFVALLILGLAVSFTYRVLPLFVPYFRNKVSHA
jgi:hypothetical protein